MATTTPIEAAAPPVDPTVGQTIRARRVQRKLSQAEAAKQAQIARRTWNEIELGRRVGSPETLASMEPVLDLPTGSLSALARNPEARELAEIRQELIGIIKTLTTREELEFARIDLIRLQIHALRNQLEGYEANVTHESPHDSVRSGQP